MKNKRILVCDGTVDGIFTAIYKAYDMRYGHENIKIIEKAKDDNGVNFELFSEYIDIETDYELSGKVTSSVRKKISQEAYETVMQAALSYVEGRSDAIYRFLILGFHMGKDVMGFLSNDSVNQVIKMRQNVWNESHHLNGFLRFSQVGDGILLATIKPKNDVLTLLSWHFSDRLNNEDFIIYDEGRGTAVLHRKNTEPILMEVDAKLIEELNRSKSAQEEYGTLWKAFYESICIKERINLNLQRNNLPLRFRDHMTEFIKDSKKG